jgi:hypothetical protein
MAASATLAPCLAGKAGAGPAVAAGMALVAAGLDATALLGRHAGFASLMPPLAAIGIGSGLTMPVTAAILDALPPARAGVAAAILNAAREASGLLGVTVIGAILTARQAAAQADGAIPHAGDPSEIRHLKAHHDDDRHNDSTHVAHDEPDAARPRRWRHHLGAAARARGGPPESRISGPGSRR